MDCTIQKYSYREKKKLSEIYCIILRDEFSWVNPNQVALKTLKEAYNVKQSMLPLQKKRHWVLFLYRTV